MHADQDDRHPWLQEETLLIQRILAAHQPVLGVCLGAQLLARAAHAPVMAMPEPEIGWYELELTPEADGDPVLGVLPERFTAFQWHYYTHGLPAGAVELVRSEGFTQAFRLGDLAWGVQFHPEVTEQQIRSWLDDEEDRPANAEEIASESHERIDEWQGHGRRLCTAFVETASLVPSRG
jgi:GMP synthase (glutamine-hydrolysing)